ncbi:hypothetical protein ACVDG5_012435 [Mesorhizobium sp. ORM6]
MRIKFQAITLALLLVGGLGPGHADVVERPSPSGGVLSLLPPPQASDHSIEIAGHTLDYHANAGTLSLLSGQGEVVAEVFYVAYSLKHEVISGQDHQRPITFVFNGVREPLPPICILARLVLASLRRRLMEAFFRRHRGFWTTPAPGLT